MYNTGTSLEGKIYVILYIFVFSDYRYTFTYNCSDLKLILAVLKCASIN